jgi:thymidine phosphorylase
LAVARTDGLQPVGAGIGPSLEARDVLQVLRGAPDAPADLRERALHLAGALLDLAPNASPAAGAAAARRLLDDGSALRKFMAICDAQGGFSEPRTADHVRPILARRTGIVRDIDNRRLAKVAKLAGAPLSRRAGLVCRTRIGDCIHAGMPLFEVHAETIGELEYALSFVDAHADIIVVDDP